MIMAEKYYPEKVAGYFLIAILMLRLIERLYLGFQIVPGYSFLIPIFIYVILRILSRKISLVSDFDTVNILLILGISVTSGSSVYINHYMNSDYVDINGVSSLSYTTFIYFYGITWLIIGIILSRMIEFGRFEIFLVLSFVIFFLIFINSDGFFLDYSAIRGSTDVERFSHLWITEGAMVVFFLLYASAQKNLNKYASIVIMFLCLISVGGRSSVIFSALSIVVYEFIVNGSARLFKLFGAFFLVLVIAFPIGMAFIDDIQINQDAFSHVFLSDGLDASGSWQERQAALEIGLSYLRDSWLWGEPRYYVSGTGEVGHYIHNLLSAWQFFGFPFFLIVVLSILRSIYLVIKDKELISRGNFGRFKILFLLFVAMVSSLTVSIASAWIWFALGLILGFPRHRAAGARN